MTSQLSRCIPARADWESLPGIMCFASMSFQQAHQYFSVEVLNIVIAMGININMGMIMCLVTGLLMIFVGNMMPKIKQNFYFGIKTPWTLADEENWFKTHRLAGKTSVFGGIVIALGAFVPGEGKAWLLLAVVLVMVAIPLIYSAVLHMKRREGK